jgi:meso-butanediol dehydrogenase / (S,S)-butanediol dehydrogenase / diacetyl reductase
MSRLKGRIAIVTGAASGLGLATSKRFAAEGATVVMVDRRDDAVRQAAEEGGQGLDPIAADITKSADLAALRDHWLSPTGAPTCCSPTRASPHLLLSAK